MNYLWGVDVRPAHPNVRHNMGGRATPEKTSYSLKQIVTVQSSGCLQIGFGPLIIDYICNFLFDCVYFAHKVSKMKENI